jgi:hypothetical protein
MRKLRNVLFACLLLLGAGAFSTITGNMVNAAETETSQNQVEDKSEYYVKALLPDNQISDQTYFDLKMKPGESQRLKVRIYNKSDKEIEVEILANKAVTSDFGVIDYSQQREEKIEKTEESSSVPDFYEISEVEEPRLKIPAGSSVVASVKVTMPKEEFDGTVLGGIYFRKLRAEEINETSKESSETNNQESMSIKNVYSYAIGVKLSETDKEVIPDFRYQEVKLGAYNYQAAIIHTIENIEPEIAKGLKMSVSIYNLGTGEQVLNEEYTSVSFAPNSIMNYPMMLKGRQLDSGRYKSVLKLEQKQGEHVWEYEKEFEITKKDKKAVANNYTVDNKLAWWVYVLIALVVVFALATFGLIGYIVQKKHSDERERDGYGDE